jgi:hypothetical protein
MILAIRCTCLLTAVFFFRELTSGAEDGTNARLRGYRELSQWAQSDGIENHLQGKCGLPVLSAALHNRGTLSPALQTSLGLLLLRPSLDTSIVAGNYRIHYDTTGVNAPAMLDASYQRIPGSHRQYVDSVAAIVNYVASYETNVLGYLPPPPDNGAGGGPEYDIYILELGSLYYGLTTPETPINNKPDGGTFTTFIEIDNDFNFVFPDSNKGMPALRVTLAHEHHHAIQIGNYGFWGNDVYFYEMTSVWMEDVVYTNVNDYHQYLRFSDSQFRRPDIPFTSNGFIMYSRAIWSHFIAKRYGRDAMRHSWEEVRNARPIQAIDNALHNEPYSSSFRQAFSEWSLWNFFTGPRADTSSYYPEGNSYPPMTQAPVGFSPPSRSIAGSLEALTARYYQVLGMPDTLTLVLSNINFAAALGNSTLPFPYTYLLNTQQVDDSYKATPVGVFFKLDAPDQTNWYTWDVVRGNIGSSTVTAGVPFPNPFLVDGRASLYIPVTTTTQIQGTLSVFSSAMDLVFSSDLRTVVPQPGKQVFAWNGKTNNGELVHTGIFFFVLELPDQTLTGKIAVVRK